MPRIGHPAMALAAMAAATLAAGCGAASTTAPGTPAGGRPTASATASRTAAGTADDAAAIEQLTAAYFHAIVTGDGATACADLTDAVRRATVAALQVMHPGITCEQGIQLAAEQITPALRNAIESARLTAVAVSGDSATAQLAVASNGQTATIPLRYARVGGAWRIDTPPQAAR